MPRISRARLLVVATVAAGTAEIQVTMVYEPARALIQLTDDSCLQLPVTDA